MYFDQASFDSRCEWGAAGVDLLAPTSAAIIIVDIFSFTTAVDVAVARGARVYPFRWKDERAAGFARQKGALLADASRRDPSGFSLSPASLLRVKPGMEIVLPSPNGATLSLASGAVANFAGCLRNASAVAGAAFAAAQAAGSRRVSVIPAGERWPDGSLRPALEDLIGAGALLNALPGARSPEAEAAVAVFLSFRSRLFETLAACSSGKEAASRGSFRDVELAAELDVSQSAPRLIAEAYQA